MTYTETNEQVPTFKQEAEMESQAFQRDVIAALETAMCVLTDSGNALGAYPGYENEAQSIHDLATRVESVRLDLGGE